jgi:O-methyltransferase
MAALSNRIVGWTIRQAKKRLLRAGFQLQRLPSGPPIVIPFWDEDAAFDTLNRQLAGYTLVDKTRCYMLYQCAKQAAGIPGDVAEVGVYRGGTARLICQTIGPTGKAIHLFDTFQGMPAVRADTDIHREGDFNDTSIERVRAYLSDCDNIHLHQGVFPQTAAPVEQHSFALVHIDVDIYQSVADCCAFFYPRMARGGIMMFDDYGFISCPGVKQAVDMFLEGKPEVPLYLPTGQCMVVKI